MELAAGVMTAAALPQRGLSTVFFGGGTPTLLGPKPLLAMLERAKDLWDFQPGVEITTEANPDSVGQRDLAELAAGGFTRVSFGVQSSEPKVLKTLDRTHNPELVPVVVHQAKEAGLQVSVDLIYGTPGETLDQWRRTLHQAVALVPDHVSAYALIVEPGTALARRIDKGELPPPDDDLQADMYAAADDILAEAGYSWYEISNWAKSSHQVSLHNLSYWREADWWGIGPGAHSHVGGVRWWNVKHPAAYSSRMAQGISPAHAREVLSPDQQKVERVLLGLRLSSGISTELIGADKSARIAEFIGRGFLDGRQALDGRLVLTPTGRLVADYVIRELS